MADTRPARRVRIATRSSQLAMVQTDWVAGVLRGALPGAEVEIVKMDTQGDRVLDKPLAAIGDKGLFTAELEAAILDGRVDFAVHSLKDLPTQLPAGLGVGAISKREPPADAVVLHARHAGVTALSALPAGAVVGTSSLRRIAQLKRAHPHLVVKDVRGNLNTRLRKLDSGDYDALILAEAGLLRMGWEERISMRLTDEFHHAVGQGALGIECRLDDRDLIDNVLSHLHDPDTATCCLAERAFLRTLEGGCQVPIGVRSQLADGGLVRLSGRVLTLDGTRCIEGTSEGPRADPEAVGQALAADLKGKGADEVLAGIRKD